MWTGLQNLIAAKRGGATQLALIPCRRVWLHNLDTAKGDIISWIGLLVNLSVSQCISASVTTCVFEQAIFLCTGLGVQLKNVVYQELMRYRMAKS